MNARTTDRFWRAYHGLSHELRQTAKKQFELWQQNPYHSSLHFKQVKDDIYSVRINEGYRALGRMEQNTVIWQWIGTHDEYERMISRL